jgi:Tol biopolymer transport system component
LLWLDRRGKQTSTVGEPLTDVVTTRLSPDGRYVALSRETHGKRDMWLMDLARGTLRRLTFDGGNRAAWSPDGSQIVFNYSRTGLSHLYRKAVGTSEPDQLLFESSEAKNVHDWSPDGRVILFSSQNPKTARDLWALPLDGDRKPFVIVQTPAEETAGAFSPDGKWIAYESNETGRIEVYVRPFPGPGRAWPISTNGAQAPQWRHDGKEVFYLSAGRLIAVPITIDAGSAVDAGNPVALFAMRAGSSYAGLSPDGQRFLISTPLEDISSSPITVILNWAGRK